MAESEQSTGETIFMALLLIGSMYAYAAYARAKSEKLKKELDAKHKLISDKLARAKQALSEETVESIEILDNVNLAETRISQGVQSLQIIDSSGVIIADGKGLNFIGPHRRMAWNWNKIIHITSNKQPPRDFDWNAPWFENFIPVKKSMQNIILPVSNRQKNSGFQFQGSDSLRIEVTDFINFFRGEIKNTKSKSKQRKNQKEATVIVNVNQTITDSVIQGNLTNIED